MFATAQMAPLNTNFQAAWSQAPAARAQVLSHDSPLADTYTASAAPAGEVNLKQMLALRAKDVPTAAHKHDFHTLENAFGNLSGAERLAAVADLRKNHPNDYQALLSDIRAGKVDSPDVKTGVSIDMLSATEWCQSIGGARVVDHLGKLYAKGDITPTRGLDGMGETFMADGKNGIGADQATSSIIKYSADYANSPEAVASILAHEGQHSFRASQGITQRELLEETDANFVQAQVWAGFGDSKYEAKGIERGGSLDQKASYLDPAHPESKNKMMNHIAAMYMGFHADKGEMSVVRGMLRDYTTINADQDGALVRQAGSDELDAIRSAARAAKSGSTHKADYQKELDTLNG